MINAVMRKHSIGVAALVLAGMMPFAGNAATFSFNTAGGNDSLVSSTTITSNTVGGTAIKAKVTAWHWNDPGDQKIVAASLGLWSPGLGVIATSAGETGSGNQHQIDNINGVDFIMLQFDHDVSLTGIGRVIFDLGFNPDDSDAAYWADSTHAVGTAATWQSNINLASFTNVPSLWSPIAGDANPGPAGISGAPIAAVWLIGAALSSSDRDDGFKLSSLTVTSATGAVPEPASWAMMIVGFGAVGAAMRRQQRVKVAFA